MSPGDSLGYLHTTRGPWHKPASLPWRRSRSHSRSLDRSRSRSSRGRQLLEGSKKLRLLLGEPFGVSAYRLVETGLFDLAELDFAAIAACGITPEGGVARYPWVLMPNGVCV